MYINYKAQVNGYFGMVPSANNLLLLVLRETMILVCECHNLCYYDGNLFSVFVFAPVDNEFQTHMILMGFF